MILFLQKRIFRSTIINILVENDTTPIVGYTVWCKIAYFLWFVRIKILMGLNFEVYMYMNWLSRNMYSLSPVFFFCGFETFKFAHLYIHSTKSANIKFTQYNLKITIMIIKMDYTCVCGNLHSWPFKTQNCNIKL